MQYIVQTGGDTIERKESIYVINAKSEEEAKEIAKEQFLGEYDIHGDGIYIQLQKRKGSSIAAIICMLIPVMLSFLNWSYTVKSGFIIKKIEEVALNLRPDMISVLFSVIIVGAWVVRFKGIKKICDNISEIFLIVTLILLVSSVIKILLQNVEFKIFGLKIWDIDTTTVLELAGILSWCGMKLVSVICLAAVVAAALSNISLVSEVMGIFGAVYVLFAFVGILLFFYSDPNLMNVFPHYKKSIYNSTNYLKNEYQEALMEAKLIKDKTITGVSKMIK